MNSITTVSRAIWLGILVVNVPVLCLICGPLLVFGQVIESGNISRSYNWLGFLIFVGGFVLGWLWWAVSVPLWRRWAYRCVNDIESLKSRAIAYGLIWPDGHFFEKTEIDFSSSARSKADIDPGTRR